MSTTDLERRAARIATISALIVVAGFVAGKAARDAILLSSFHITSLPIFMGLSALMSFPIIMLAGRLMTRFGPARLMPVLNAVSAVCLIGEWFLLERSPRATTIAIFFHLSTSGAVLVSGFWSIVNERFDVQSAKRHIGRIGMGATLGGIAGGLIAERTAVYLSHDKILLVLAALQATSALALYLFGRGAHAEPITAPADEGTWFALRKVATSPLLRNVGAIVILGAIAAGAMDYVFKADLVRGASKEDLLRSLSLFYTITSVITAVVQVAFCGPLVARLGVPRSVGTLPFTVTAFGALALLVPSTIASLVARGAESVTRNSVYRAGYELLYAPLGEEHKRPTKVVLDVGADRIGDLLGAQLVGALVYVLIDPRHGLLIATVVIGVIGTIVALRLPRSYTSALEDSLMERAAEEGATAVPAVALQPEPWITLSRLPTLGQEGDTMLLARRRRERRKREAAAAGAPSPSASMSDDTVVAIVAELRSNDPARIKEALSRPIAPVLAPLVIELVGRDEVAREALNALNAIAPRCTGLLVDALVDQARDVTLRRRLPAVLLAGEPSLAAWGLWRALGDPSFEIRYRSGAVLSRLAADGHLDVTLDDVLEAVKREFVIDATVWKSRRLIADLVDSVADGDDAISHGTGLEHVFTVLGLALPAEPLRIALHAVQTDDPDLRGTALEYLESILPADVRAQLWPLLEGEGDVSTAAAAAAEAVEVPPPRPMPVARHEHHGRSQDEILTELERLYSTLAAKVHPRATTHH